MVSTGSEWKQKKTKGKKTKGKKQVFNAAPSDITLNSMKFVFHLNMRWFPDVTMATSGVPLGI